MTGVPIPTGPSGGGSGGTYTNASPTPVTIGGIPAGSTFAAQTMKQMWDALLYPYQTPTFSSFLMSGYIVIEVGDSIPSGPLTFTWTTTNPTNITANSISILDVTGSTTLETGLANTGSAVHNFAAPITYVVAASNLFRIQGVDTESNAFHRDHTVFWWWRVYYGESASAGPLTEANIKALRIGALQAGFAATYAYQAGGYKYLAIPAAFGTPASFTDASTGFPVAMEAPYTVSITNAFGVVENYSVYRTTNVLVGAINIIVA